MHIFCHIYTSASTYYLSPVLVSVGGSEQCTDVLCRCTGAHLLRWAALMSRTLGQMLSMTRRDSFKCAPEGTLVWTD